MRQRFNPGPEIAYLAYDGRVAGQEAGFYNPGTGFGMMPPNDGRANSKSEIIGAQWARGETGLPALSCNVLNGLPSRHFGIQHQLFASSFSNCSMLSPANQWPLPGQVDPNLTPCAFCRRRLHIGGKPVFQSCSCKAFGPPVTIVALVAGGLAALAGGIWWRSRRKR